VPHGFRRRPLLFDLFRDDGEHISRLLVNLKIPRLRLGELQEISDQGKLGLHGASYPTNTFFLCRRDRSLDSVFDERGVSIDRVERILQIVAHASHQFVASFHGSGQCPTPFLGLGRGELQPPAERDHYRNGREGQRAKRNYQRSLETFGGSNFVAPRLRCIVEGLVELSGGHQRLFVQRAEIAIATRNARARRSHQHLKARVPALIKIPQFVVTALYLRAETSGEGRERSIGAVLQSLYFVQARKNRAVAGLKKLDVRRCLQRESQLQMRRLRSSRFGELANLTTNR
jgi:hypothetical protein